MRDWAELPRDALLAVLHRLEQADVLMGAEQVCRPWRRAAREEPVLWRRVDLRRRGALTSPGVDVEAMAYAALRRGAGRCEAFWAEDVVDDNFISFLSCEAPALKSLCLISCNISTQGLNGAIRRLPMLEVLELSLYSSSGGLCNLAETCTAAAEACPLLKRLRLSKYRFHWLSGVGDSEAMEVSKMRGLRSLQLFGNSLGNAGLAAILEGCASLESLDIRHCFNVEMDNEMRAKCAARLQTLRLPDDSMDDYDISFGSPEMNPRRPELGVPGSPEMNFGFRGDILWDSW
ncbi:F-box protein SKIP19 [Dichanthelium oligosanthes]|uniref:F-box protein SKIP19 n=1 Tax=Dichanthelium oligosanthes TaxID=888268 RepID=A0A1E5WHV9_9POAL|nr:F-box protein SKIP19 [Dichanthelium oligosanthes]